FDNQGNLMHKVEVKGIKKLCFYREHLLWLDGFSLKAISLSMSEIITVAVLDTDTANYIQIGQERLALVTGDKVILYPLNKKLRSLK
ncbi:hypothetical protein ACWKSR_11360, partial [Campylobacter fetus subsp. venerealis]